MPNSEVWQLSEQTKLKGSFFFSLIVIHLKTFPSWKMVASRFVTSDICLAIGSVLLENSLQLPSSCDWCPVKTEVEKTRIWNSTDVNTFLWSFQVVQAYALKHSFWLLQKLPWYQWIKLAIVYKEHWRSLYSLDLIQIFITCACTGWCSILYFLFRIWPLWSR